RSGREEHRSLIHLARNPYMLAALLTVYKHQGELPTNTGALFHTLAQVLWERERLRNTRGWVPFEQMRERFGQLAFQMIDTYQPLDVPLAYALEHVKDESLLKAGASAGFIRLNQDSVRFSHQLILEYFAAWGLQRVGVMTRIRPPEFSWGKRKAQRWNDVVVALCGIVPEPSELINQVSEIDFLLAAECVRSVAAVSLDCRNLIIKQLGDALNTPHNDLSLRRACAEALGKIGGRKALDLLKESINDAEQSLKRTIAQALGQIGNPSAVDVLIELLNNSEQSLQRTAAQALGQIGDQRAINALEQTLIEGEHIVKQIAADALVQIGAPSVYVLAQALQHKNWEVQYTAAEALGRIGKPSINVLITKSIYSKDINVRK
ncbi:MAG: hypothetical protein CUN55_15695, partial [Phototrophicales bacterium]